MSWDRDLTGLFRIHAIDVFNYKTEDIEYEFDCGHRKTAFEMYETAKDYFLFTSPKAFMEEMIDLAMPDTNYAWVCAIKNSVDKEAVQEALQNMFECLLTWLEEEDFTEMREEFGRIVLRRKLLAFRATESSLSTADEPEIS